MNSLTEREREVFDLLCQGMQSKEVARELGISPRTVEQHASHIIEKTGAHNMLHAATILRG